MAQEATAYEQKKFKVPRIPGDIMIYPKIVGLLLNTFCPQVFEIGGFFTAACRGGSNTIVAAILLFVGAGISFKSTPGAIKTGIVVLIPKLVVAAALGLGVAYCFNDNFLGLSSVSIIGGIALCNMALYTGIMGEFGDESEQGAVGILFFTAGPAVTMIILGVSGLANIPIGTIIGSILPLVIGMVLGNLFPFIKNLLVPGANPAIAVIGFQLGAAMSLSSFCVVTNALRLNLFDLHDARRDHKRASHLKEVPEIKEETTMKKTISIEGMMCTHCEATVKKALEALPEVTEAEVSHTAGTAVVTLSAPVDDAALKAAVEAKDYTVTGIA